MGPEAAFEEHKGGDVSIEHPRAILSIPSTTSYEIEALGRHAGCGKLSQIKWEVVSITLVHDLESQVRTVQHIGPCIDNATIGGDHRLIEVKAIQIEGHCRDPQSCKPDADHRPDSQEEVQRSAVIEGCGLEEQSTALAVSSHDVVPNSMKPAEGPRTRHPKRWILVRQGVRL